MKTMKYVFIIAAIAAVSLFMIKCIDDEAVFVSPENVTERVDMVIEGAINESVHLESLERDYTKNLVDFNFYGMGSNKIDFIVDLGKGRFVTISLTNQDVVNPWEHEINYSLFPSQVIEDKTTYVTLTLTEGKEGEEIYQSNIGTSCPQGSYLNVFRIVKYDPAASEILCRVVDLPMCGTDGQGDITLSGTFRGSLTFLGPAS